MKIINSLFLLLFLSIPVLGQEVQSADSTVEIRQFDSEKLATYRSDAKFQYQVAKPEPPNAFELFIERAQAWFMRMLTSGTTGTIIEILWKLALVVGFIFFIIKIFGVEITTVFKPNKVKNLDYEVSEEQLGLINFEEEIASAIEQKQWRFAIRLTYLNALKLMADSGLLKVKKGKTNRDYLYELSGNPAEADFEKLSFIFDYTWYGHFEANDNIAAQAQEHFSNIVGTKSSGK
ncbi:DUF4129 domain-containing protein [Roseivirga sp.]|uniref:DUF4129 domain-containing protein n=1 Tax=Roseivirga sp. TaxID=1964215 RepID=UPI003B8DCC2D